MSQVANIAANCREPGCSKRGCCVLIQLNASKGFNPSGFKAEGSSASTCE